MSIRNYGLPDSNPVSVPVAAEGPKELCESGCPNCGCKQIMEIKVKVEQNLIKGGKGIGTYFGCPACPWASPMMVLSSNISQ